MYKEGKYRVFSPTRVVDELELTKNKYGARAAYFDDDSFTISRKHVLGICDEITRRGLDVKWSCMGDAMAVTDDMIGRMADAGCIGMKFGIESGDPALLRAMGKPLDLDRALAVAGKCARHGIKTHATFTFGIQGETAQSLQKTLEYARRLDVDTVQFSVTIPFPGTRYFDSMFAEGRIISADWRDYDGSSNCLVRFDNLGADEVERFSRSFGGKWLGARLSHPWWVLRQFRYMGRTLMGQGSGGVIRLGANALESLWR